MLLENILVPVKFIGEYPTLTIPLAPELLSNVLWREGREGEGGGREKEGGREGRGKRGGE